MSLNKRNTLINFFSSSIPRDKETDTIAKQITKLIYTNEKIEGQPHKGEGLTLANIMYNNYRYSWGLYIIVGNLGAGKSSYAFKVAYDFLNRYGRSVMSRAEYEAWRKFDDDEKYRTIMKKYLVFTVDELEGKVKRASWKNRFPLLIWDDAGVYGSSYLFFVDPYLTMVLSGLLQVIRTRVANLLMTVPSPDLIARVFRLIPERRIIAVDNMGGWNSRARGYTMVFAVKKDVPSLTFYDFFNKKLPDEFYKSYMALRDSYVDRTLAMYEELIELRRLEMEYRKRTIRDKLVKRRKQKSVGEGIEIDLSDILNDEEE